MIKVTLFYVIVICIFLNSFTVGGDGSVEPPQMDLAVHKHAKGVLDRYEDDMAVILVEALNEELVVPQHVLPANSKAGMWFDLELVDGSVSNMSIDWQITRQEQENVRELMKRLQE